ncbi:fimbria/pilus outer membrane usher protein [Escherichia marmotae]|uniref:Fimbrial biogenesis outer membrane usher protein n=1 Tax=Escherichia marmotae TaxID=1499973 RepID=A0A7L5X467_9ESCH|nr:fimbria/pilus outer membrane usher protein [Escherichia marmotae]AUT26846.1 fimbrial biogenesis outer membrane usher protein [Escherichia marmotae]MDQ9283454.1 fimbrial biogenesis outer membrane usher protein [Escherichia marmotae]MEC9674934.1 fimbria/pilus outer membrane usher protein [Escherichia marmotae]MED0607176.1 fimbria/pilus outer membrane usher protein [Escherichia marmotae]MED9652528.1 fimbria/pilus outer membrane usher protein [Escherichia marmotae]
MSADVRQKRKILSKIACFIALQCSISASNPAFAREYFNPALLGIDGPNTDLIDLSSFSEGIGQMPGTYRVDIIINQMAQGTYDIPFTMQKETNGNSSLQPCISPEMLKTFGVRTEQFPQLNNSSECANLSAIPMASTEFIFNRQQLMITVPQAAMNNSVRGFVPPERLDEGINALLLNYNFSGANTATRNSDGTDTDSYYLNLLPGLNIGPWRVRNYSTWSRDTSGGDKQENWDSIYTYAQRNIIALKSQLTVGDSTSASDMFDSVPFRGAQIASDDDMLPDSMRGYAPMVRGIARTNAQVIIKQNGYTIYQTYVSPGAFEITDMYPTGSSGDLDVTVKEADGSEQHQIIPFASVPILQREGRLKYSLTSGQYRPYDNNVETPWFTQSTAIYGLPAGFTLYGGGQFSQHYQSLLGGLGKNFGTLGAVSVDVAQAWSQQQDQDKIGGQSWRIRYSKNFLETGTNISISGYRYSTSGYYSLQEVLDTWRDSNKNTTDDRRRNRAEFLLAQNLGLNYGSLSLNAISEDYWNSDRKMRSIGAGYSNSWNNITFNINYSYNRNTSNSSITANNNGQTIYDEDQILSLSISLPLDRWLSNSSASYNLNTSKKGNTNHSIGLNGSALEQQNLNWSLQESQTNHGEGNGGYASVDYQGTYARLNAAYSYDQNQQRVNYGIEGGVVAHADGITLSQSLGETVALVQAPGANGVSVSNQTGVKTDYRGYTIVPFVNAYKENAISLETETLPDDADLTISSRTVTPTRGAIVRATFNTQVGKRVLINLTRPGGTAVPFGALASIDKSTSAQGFIVGDNGQVYLTGMPESGALKVKWGNGVGDSCQVSFNLPVTAQTGGVIQTNGVCK